MDTFTFHTDPGHGWLEVPRALLAEFGIQWSVSSFSYQSGDSAYLEEDCDAGIFVRAYQDKHGRRPEFVERYEEDSPIRNYSRYQAGSGGGDETAHIRASMA